MYAGPPTPAAMPQSGEFRALSRNFSTAVKSPENAIPSSIVGDWGLAFTGYKGNRSIGFDPSIYYYSNEINIARAAWTASKQADTKCCPLL